ncbi:MAG: hypothetical protein NVS2B16_28530 [Chloroflexota bacterium]
MGATERGAEQLLRLAVHDKDQLVIAGHSHQDLACVFGMYRETVTNALDHLKAEELIEVGCKQVGLLQPDRTCVIAGEGERD